MRQLHDALLNSVGPISQPPFNGHLGARGNGNGHADHDVGGNGRTEFDRSVKSKKKTRGPKPRVRHGRNQAACHAYGAVLLVRCGLTIEEAIACTTSSTNYVTAMKSILASGDQHLLDRVLNDQVGIFAAAAQVRPLVEMKTAFAKLSEEQRINWATEEDPNRLFEQVIVPAAAKQRARAELIPIIDP
jgi:hypothetical protein